MDFPYEQPIIFYRTEKRILSAGRRFQKIRGQDGIKLQDSAAISSRAACRSVKSMQMELDEMFESARSHQQKTIAAATRTLAIRGCECLLNSLAGAESADSHESDVVDIVLITPPTSTATGP